MNLKAKHIFICFVTVAKRQIERIFLPSGYFLVNIEVRLYLLTWVSNLTNHASIIIVVPVDARDPGPRAFP